MLDGEDFPGEEQQGWAEPEDQDAEALQTIDHRRAACERLREELAAVCKRNEEHRERMRLETAVVPQQSLTYTKDNDSAKARKLAARLSRAQLEQQERREAKLQIRAQHLCRELSQLRREVEVRESQAQEQETEISLLKVDLMHVRDVVESTHCAVRHRRVDGELLREGLLRVPQKGDRELVNKELLPAQLEASSGQHQLSNIPRLEQLAAAGGWPSFEVQVEASMRRRVDDDAGLLSKKSQRLFNVAASQQELIAQLKQRLSIEKGRLVGKEQQLAEEAKLQRRLRHELQRRSNLTVDAALGLVRDTRRASSVPTGRCLGNGAEEGGQRTHLLVA